MAFFNNIYNKKESFYMRIKWSIIIILSVLFLSGIAYFFYFIFSPANSNQMKEIKDSWVFYSKDDPDFKFDSKYTRTIPTVDKDETFIMETTLEKPLNEANLLIKGNHQWITVYLNGNILYQREDYDAESNPGLSLAVIDLPSDYIGKKLMISVSSPYHVNRFYLFSISTTSINDDHCSFHCYWDVYLYYLLDVQTKTA